MTAPAALSKPLATPTSIPLTRPTIDDETIAGVAEVLRSGWITSGPQVKAFEAKLSEYFGGRPVRAFNSGTCTMEIALRIAGIGPGDEVITTPLSWVATSNVILEVGAKPVFVDIDPATRNIDLNRVEAAITPATKAIMPVDLAGLPVDRDRLYAIAKKHGATSAQVALKWLLDQGGVAAIPKSSRPEGQQANLDCLKLTLDDADRKAIAALPKNQRCVIPGFGPDWD